MHRVADSASGVPSTAASIKIPVDMFEFGPAHKEILQHVPWIRAPQTTDAAAALVVSKSTHMMTAR
jgi:hypothetical protein